MMLMQIENEQVTPCQKMLTLLSMSELSKC